MATLKDPKTIETAPPFSTMFTVDPAVLDRITRSMRTNGYHPTKAVTAWKDAFGDPGRTVVTDGHTRLAAALAAGVKEIPVTHRRYTDLAEALGETIAEQRDRRNLTTGQIAASVVMELDSGHVYPGQRNDLTGYSAQDLAGLAGCSKKTIDQLRAIVASGNESLLAEVRAGTLSVKAAYAKAKRQTAADAPPARPGDGPSEPEGEGESVPPGRDGDVAELAAAFVRESMQARLGGWRVMRSDLESDGALTVVAVMTWSLDTPAAAEAKFASMKEVFLNDEGDDE